MVWFNHQNPPWKKMIHPPGYELLDGSGPVSGWVSVKISGKELLKLIPDGPEAGNQNNSTVVLFGLGENFKHKDFFFVLVLAAKQVSSLWLS